MNRRTESVDSQRHVIGGAFLILLVGTGLPVAQDIARLLPGFGRATGVVLVQGEPKQGIPVYLHQVKPERRLCMVKMTSGVDGRWTMPNIEPGDYFAGIICPATGVFLAYEPREVRSVEAGKIVEFPVQYLSVDPREKKP